MKKRDVILDFTALLDVTLILLFFFVIFSHISSEESQAKTESKRGEMESAIAAAQSRERSAQDMLLQLESELGTIRASDPRRARNLEAILEYGRSGNLKLLLVSSEQGWQLRINRQSLTLAELPIDTQLGRGLVAVLQQAEYAPEDTVFCDLIFDGSKPGTALAYRRIQAGLEEAAVYYPYLYRSETDLSIGEE